MIKKIEFSESKTVGGDFDVIADKIDEIAEAVNSLTEITTLKKRIAELEVQVTNNAVAKVACGGTNTTANGMFNTSTPWEPYREKEMTTITHSKDGMIITVDKKEMSFSIKVTAGKIDCKITDYDIKHKIDNLEAIKTNITSLEVRHLKY
ncbi:hypothetical protein LGL08_20590 [Clostridium estertheticum]|uniref:hypothetical protein n=1 Tax=Clostridium estertheticum TaxID=238834 RepID=UPI001CF387A9|nr:hypothetical protein [Clostridium estertheticum]MCB2308893.1 hypothetical protein [Clostridium estertheticum]MCB2347305.1 hypothetical protein [Clostridium estertheticum]MCB2351928.1 hypothetical protein [Clostridium estertheticum]WAG48505.1 hypothetical protein LL127_23210 [Clostridium estertheticum]